MLQIYTKNAVYPNESESASLDTLETTWDKTSFEGENELSKLTPQPYDKKTLSKRAQRKKLSDSLILKLVDVADAKQVKAYWATWHCTKTLHIYSDGTLTAKYCKKRWCSVCNAIRTAQLIRRYEPIFKGWQDVHFVTLTLPNVPAAGLSAGIADLYAGFVACKDRAKKRAQRGKAPKLVGVRKLECTYNAYNDDFHPHFHFILDNAQSGRALVSDWLELFPQSDAKAQDCRPADANSLHEIFKYFTKLISGRQGDGIKPRAIHADALNLMFEAITGCRTFQSFGFRLPTENESENERVSCADVIAVAPWIAELSDWANSETGELLSGYIPSDAMKEIVSRVIVRPGYPGNGQRDFAHYKRPCDG